MTTPEHYDLAIRGPIPFGILIPLGKMIDAVWPNAQIVTDKKQMPPGHDGTVFRIPRSDIAHDPDPETIQRIADEASQAEADGANDASLKHFDAQNILVTPPQELIHTLSVMCLGIMRGWPDANYLVQDVHLPEGVEDDGGSRFYEITVRRRDKPTPHDMRGRAESRVTELEQELAAAQAEIARLQQWEAVEVAPEELESGR